MKNSKFHKRGDFTGLDSARKLARKLFSGLHDVNLTRSHLVVEGKFHCARIVVLVLNDTSDFYPYFRSTSEAVSVIWHKQPTTSLIDYLQHDAFALFDKDGNGDISKREMREAVQRIYRERKSLIAGLKVDLCLTFY